MIEGLERTVPELERPRLLPQRPSLLTVRVECPNCTNCLAERDGEWLWVEHRRRRFLAHLPARIICERCGFRLTISEPEAA